MYNTDKPNETTVAEPATRRMVCCSPVTCLCISSSCWVIGLSAAVASAILLMKATGAAGGGGGGATGTGAATGGGGGGDVSTATTEMLLSFGTSAICCALASASLFTCAGL